MSELKAISGHEIREDIDYNTRGIDPEDKEWHNYGKELCDTLYYRKSEADKLLAELEESHKMEVEQLLMEIVELKTEKKRLKEIKDKYSSCAEKAINSIAKCELKVRSLSRALFKACANWAFLAQWERGELIENWEKWENVEHQCLKKAGEFK
mgnify:CR=1 FL=1